MKRTLPLLLFLFLLSFGACAQKVQPYLKMEEMPNAVQFLPPPPMPGTPTYIQDTAMYFYAKKHLRTPERSRRAILEGTPDIDTMARMYSGAFGMEISAQKTPKTMHLLRRSVRTIRLGATIPKKVHMRMRPFVYYGESTLMPEYEEHEKKTGSYPSGHSIRGWGMALVLAALNPERQDTLLRMGYEWGQSRVIAGYHWQSDVDASRFLASACFARLQTCQEYLDDFEAAREELRAIKDED